MLGKDLKNIKIPLTLCGRTFEISFDFNSMAELEDIYEGGFDTAMKSMAMFLAQLTQHFLIVKK